MSEVRLARLCSAQGSPGAMAGSRWTVVGSGVGSIDKDPDKTKDATDIYKAQANMENIYDEIEIEDFTFDPITQLFQYPCPCGDKFAIGIDDLQDGDDIAVCPSCSLMVRVIFDAEDLQEYYDQLD